MSTNIEEKNKGNNQLLTENCTNAFDCLGNSCRRRILQLLVNEPHYVSQIAKILDLSQPAVLKQMNILKEKGLVTETKGNPIFTRERAKGPEPNYFQVSRSFYLSYILTPYSIREKILPLPTENVMIEPRHNDILESFSEFSDKIHYLNGEVTKINKETQELEKQIIELEKKKLGLIQEANVLINSEEDLKIDTEDNYLQRLIIKQQICQDRSCVEEIQRMLSRTVGDKEKISIAMKTIQDKHIKLNIIEN
ncbi:MAG: hypothetical protein HeimC3_28140 [Candidatus Heimdallarchaeota archaeon LC_3]|nr:MAG: hypothetical protein HeimC3_28140 [Candidatus Heimdallarchaeota archaeon LC_3]